jgi:hypothetical protein
MRFQFKPSIKHVQINKANNLIFIVVALSALVVSFSLVSAKTLLGQSSFQHKVLKEKNTAIKDLKDNIEAANTLKTQYDTFENANPNILGGQGGTNVNSTGSSDGDNAKIVLDALPASYDFPALTSSLEKIIENDHLTVQGISGTDNTQTINNPTGTTSTASTTPGSSQTLPFTVTIQTDYNSSLNLVKDFERSIRPVDVTGITMSGRSSSLNISMQAVTYYQPSVSLQIGQKEITK